MKITISLAIVVLVVLATAAWPVTTHAARTIQSPRVVHIVRPGETLSGIAATYGITRAALEATNNIINANSIYAGMALIVPSASTSRTASAGLGSAAPSNTQSSPPKSTYQRSPGQSVTLGCGSTYVVKRGDTVSRIARLCGVSTTSLLRANNLDAYGRIYVGQVLVLSSTAPLSPVYPTRSTASMAACSNPYIVRPGDTLFRIARLCGISVADLYQRNGLTSDTIRAGQSLQTSRGIPWIPIPVRAPGIRKLTPVPPFPRPQPTRQPPGFYAAPTPQIEATISRW